MTFLRLLLAQFAGCALLMLAGPAAALDADAARQAIGDALTRHADTLPGVVQFDIGPIANPTLLAGCEAVDAALPAGARPMGRTAVTLRCLAGATWTMNVQVTIRVMTDYVVTSRPVAGGAALSGADVALAHGDLGELPLGTLTDTTQAIGRLARLNLPAGKPLRADYLRAPQVIKSGQAVRLLSRGAGFEVASEGTALNAAAVGDLVKVRLANGQIVSGRANAAGIVEVAL